MSQRGFMVMGLQLLGVFSMIYAPRLLEPAIYVFYVWRGQKPFPVVTLLPFLVSLIGGMVLVVYGTRLAGALGHSLKAMRFGTGVNGRQLQAIGFSCAGILMLLGVSWHLERPLRSVLVLLGFYQSTPGTTDQFIINILLSNVVLILQIGLGLGLFFGGRRLADWWHDHYAPPEEGAEHA
ncbi:MAG: hypothetical protein R6V12_20440 [Candidatus Hydrogenedentota bacterium]